MNVTASVRYSGGVTIIDLDGRVTLGDAAELLRDTVLRESAGSQSIILNMAGVTYMDSAGLGELVGAHASVTNSGGRIVLLNVQNRLQELLDMTKISTLFASFADEQQAIRSFERAASA